MLITNGKPVTPGTSGGITPLGTSRISPGSILHGFPFLGNGGFSQVARAYSLASAF